MLTGEGVGSSANGPDEVPFIVDIERDHPSSSVAMNIWIFPETIWSTSEMISPLLNDRAIIVGSVASSGRRASLGPSEVTIRVVSEWLAASRVHVIGHPTLAEI